jgi:hypothetical protein
MKNKKERIIMTNELQIKYDQLCYATLANVKHLTGEADRVSFKNFDAQNEEHLCVLCVTIACLGILNREEIAIDCGRRARKKLRKKYQASCDICKLDEEDENVIDICDMLNYMRGPAKELCGEDFTFGDIYKEFYCEKGE